MTFMSLRAAMGDGVEAEKQTKQRRETASTFTVRLYLSGPMDVAKQIIRAECLREGLCVTVEPCTFIYTGGEEAGYVVGLLNYPRFPTTKAALTERARDLMHKLLDGTYQHSALLVTQEATEWVTKREEVKPKEHYPDFSGLPSCPGSAARVVQEVDRG